MESSFHIRALEFDKIRDYIALLAFTDPARNQIRQILPSDDLGVIQNQLDLTEEMQALISFDDPFPIDSILDIRPFLKKISVPGTMISGPELLKVFIAIQTYRKLQSYLRQRSIKYPLLSEIISPVHQYQPLEKAISACIDDQGNIRDDASPKLRHIRREMISAANHARKKIESLARKYADDGYTADSVVTIREGRMVLPVKEQHKNTIRGFIHDMSSSGQTVFIEPVEVLELNNNLRRLQLNEAQEIERILTELSDLIREQILGLIQDAEIFTKIEIIYAKAVFARSVEANKPALNTRGFIHIVNGMHPLLLIKELLKNPEQRKKVVPLNLTLGQNEGEDGILIISGPNAGGKTVALKTAGLLTMMAQSGMLVPVSLGSNIAVFRNIFADIGDDQSIENDLSTFSSHIRQLASMSSRVDERTFIMIDEIGSSTSPKEGASLAIALLEYFIVKKARVIVTTHHGELKAFAHQTTGIINGSMEFNLQTLEPTYVFRSGIPGSSYAFDIARRMGLNPDIILRAKEVAGRETQQIELLINDLHMRTKEYDRKIADISREQARLNGLQALYNGKFEELKIEEKNYRKKLLAEKEEFLRRVRKETDEAIHMLKQSYVDKTTVQSIKSLLKEHQSVISGESQELKRRNDLLAVDQNELLPGQKIYIPSMEMEGTVLSEADSSGLVLIAAGQLKMRLSPDQLAKIDKPAETNTAYPRQKIEWDTENIKKELNLRGMTVDEGISKVDEYLSNAIVMGFKEVQIIHGKGSGALRKGITSYLKNDKRVVSCRLGVWGEGDTGVTIVSLRLE